MSEFKCCICDKVFSANKNLRKHGREIHDVPSDSLDLYAPKVCLSTNTRFCVVCKEQVPSNYGSYEVHYRTHDINLKKGQHSFESANVFEQWKTEIEKETSVQFFKFRGNRQTKTGVQKYTLQCSRSGSYVPEGKGERHLKIQGSKKIDGTCPAAMQVCENEDGSVDAKFIETHVGHPISEYTINGKDSSNA